MNDQLGPEYIANCMKDAYSCSVLIKYLTEGEKLRVIEQVSSEKLKSEPYFARELLSQLTPASLKVQLDKLGHEFTINYLSQGNQLLFELPVEEARNWINQLTDNELRTVINSTASLRIINIIEEDQRQAMINKLGGEHLRKICSSSWEFKLSLEEKEYRSVLTHLGEDHLRKIITTWSAILNSINTDKQASILLNMLGQEHLRNVIYSPAILVIFANEETIPTRNYHAVLHVLGKDYVHSLINKSFVDIEKFKLPPEMQLTSVRPKM